MAVDYLRVPGIVCDHCVHAITESLNAQPGVQQVIVSIADKSVQVNHTNEVSVEALVRAINEAGYNEVSLLI